MKIIQVCPRYYPDIGGIETHVREISERLVMRGFDVEVVCTGSNRALPEQEIINGVKVTRFRAYSPSDAYYLSPAIYFYLKSKRNEVIHAHNYHAFPAFFAALAAKGRFFFTPHYHGGSHSHLRDMLLKPYQWFGRFIFEKAEKVVCVSKYEMRLIKNDFHVPVPKLVYIPNGLNMNEFKDIKECKKESRFILYAGRLEPYKGVQYLIKALPLLPDFRLRIIGKGNYEKKLHQLAKKLHISERIDWLKDVEREEYLSHFKSADVFVNLSTFESYGITVAEALASGTPCIVSKGGALEEFVDNEGCVGLQYPIDVKNLASTIESRKRIVPRKMPDWDEVTSEMIKIYS